MRRAPRSAIMLVVALSPIAGVAALACSSFSSDAGQEDDAMSPEGAVFESSTPIDAMPVIDADADADAGSGHDAQFAIACGSDICGERTGGPQACCYTESNGVFTCVAKADVCPSPTSKRYSCDDKDDCVVHGLSGTICCGSLDPAVKASTYLLASSSCVLPENCVASNEVRRCDRAVAGQCPTGKACTDLKTHRSPDDASVWNIDFPFPACQ